MKQPNRWNHYVLERGDGLLRFWTHHLSGQPRRLLFILGKGFDPRMCLGLSTVLRLQQKGSCDVALLEFSESPTSHSWSYQKLVDANMATLRSLMEGRGKITSMPLEMRTGDGRRIASTSALNLFRRCADLGDYTDVIVDISSAPRGVYLPLIAKILHLIDQPGADPAWLPVNFHLLAWEDIDLDARIKDNGVEERADYLAPFRGGMDREATAGQPRVWIPLLGEGQRVQLERIATLVAPDEISPVLPSPARNPRRGDNLVIDYHDLLFDSWGIEPKNFIYASEQNPFEVYRQVGRAICAYRDSFGPLGGAKFVLSALSSKLLSVGALLVAYDFKAHEFDVGIAHIDCHGYDFEEPEKAPEGELFGLWLAGEWEAKPVAAPCTANPFPPIHK
jgi:hypothetical protein